MTQFAAGGFPVGYAFDQSTETRWDGVVGTGIEVGLAPGWSVALEYDHLFMDSSRTIFITRAGVPLRANTVRQDVDMGTVRNYRFGAPVAAKYDRRARCAVTIKAPAMPILPTQTHAAQQCRMPSGPAKSEHLGWFDEVTPVARDDGKYRRFLSLARTVGLGNKVTPMGRMHAASRMIGIGGQMRTAIDPICRCDVCDPRGDAGKPASEFRATSRIGRKYQ
jgi:hypothetical protein